MGRPMWVREDITEVDWLRQKLNEEVKYSVSLVARNSELVEGIKNKAENYRIRAKRYGEKFDAHADPMSAQAERYISLCAFLNRTADELESLLPPDPATERKEPAP